jgi:hypothetical protein
VVSLVEHDRVERVATGLDAHAGQDVLPAVVGQRDRVGEHLRDRLERERPVVVALLARLLGRVVAALGVLEAIQASRVDDTMAFEQLPEAAPDTSAHLGVRHAWGTLHRCR